MKSSVCAQSFAGTGWQTELVGFWLKVVDAMHSESVFFSQESLSSTTYPEEKVCVMRFKISPETCESHASHGIENIDLHQTSKVEGFFCSTVESQPPKINALNFIKLLDMEELGDLEHHAEMPRKHAQPPTSCSSPRVLVENLPNPSWTLADHDEHQPVLDNLFLPQAWTKKTFVH